jgi:hypothetical protein
LDILKNDVFIKVIMAKIMKRSKNSTKKSVNAKSGYRRRSA